MIQCYTDVQVQVAIGSVGQSQGGIRTNDMEPRCREDTPLGG